MRRSLHKLMFHSCIALCAATALASAASAAASATYPIKAVNGSRESGTLTVERVRGAGEYGDITYLRIRARHQPENVRHQYVYVFGESCKQLLLPGAKPVTPLLILAPLVNGESSSAIIERRSSSKMGALSAPAPDPTYAVALDGPGPGYGGAYRLAAYETKVYDAAKIRACGDIPSTAVE